MTAETGPCTPSEFWEDEELTVSEKATVATVREARAVAGARSSSPMLESTPDYLRRLTREADDARAELAALRSDLARAARHPYKGANDTDASMLLAAAWRLECGFEPGGSNTKQTVARVLREVVDLLAPPSAPSSPVDATGAPEGTPGGFEAPTRLTVACVCGDCYHPAFGPNTDGDPCDWCRDCGCASADHKAGV